MMFIALIVFVFIEKNRTSLSNNWLYFLTRDATEYLILTIIGYIAYFYVLNLKKLWQKVVSITFLMSILLGLSILLSYRAFDKFIGQVVYNGFAQYLGKALLFYVFIHFINRLEFFNKYKKLEIVLSQSKERLLRNQLHPHFLFNVFNSLYSMSLKQDSKTPDTILKLSNMMRYLTDDSVNKQVKLTQELKFIEDYITIEKIRFGEKANIHLNVEGTPKGKNIEPLLLMVLVENAFKHGFYTNDDNSFVNIDVKIVDFVLHFSVENSVQKEHHIDQTDRKGVGLKNLKKRLKLSYPKKSKLTLRPKNDVYLAQLEIDLK